MSISLDEIVSKRKDSVDENGALYKMVVNEKGYDEESREIKFVMSAESEDRYGDIVRQEGLDLGNFLKNPMALAYHRHTDPIGMWNDVKLVKNGRPKRTEGVLKLHPEGTTASVDEVANLLSVGGLKACSIGFKPLEAEWIKDKDGHCTWAIDFIESDLLECSVVSIPAHPSALMKAAEGNSPLLKETMEFILDTMCEKTTGGLFVRKEFADAFAEMQGNRISKVIDKRDAGIIPKTEIDAQLEKTIADNLEISDLTPEQEKKVGSILDAVVGAVRGAFGQDKTEQNDWEEYQSNITVQSDGENIEFVEEIPSKSIAAKEVVKSEDCIVQTNDTLVITTQSMIAEFKIAGEDDQSFYLDLHRCYEPETPAPDLVPNSRAMAEAKTKKLMAELRLKGSIT